MKTVHRMIFDWYRKTGWIVDGCVTVQSVPAGEAVARRYCHERGRAYSAWLEIHERSGIGRRPNARDYRRHKRQQSQSR
jgi:hypothetical protein